MTVEINTGSSWLDLTPYIKAGGWKDTRNDVDGDNAGRNVQGTMIRDRVAIKHSINVTCRPLLKSELDTIRAAIEPESFQIRFCDDNGAYTYRNVYTNNLSWTYLIRKGSNEYYTDFSFPMIEM